MMSNTFWTDVAYEPTRRAPVGAFVRFVASVLLAVIFAVAVAPVGMQGAFAADDGDKKSVEKLEESKKQLGVTESGDAGFEQILKKARGDGQKSSFVTVLNRVLQPGYIYNHPRSSTDGYYQGNTKWSCDVNDPNRGLLTYHNCDVPNFTADLGQNLFSALKPGGVLGGGSESAKLEVSWLGLPTGVKSVPSAAAARVEKYTALELFGYNLRVTRYEGEFDHIQVQTQARLMSNFGASQTLALGVNAIFNGITEGASGAVAAFKDEVSKGNYFGALAAAYNGGTQSSVAAAIETILDTSDANVMATRGYARVGIDKTLYNARSATNAEMEQEIVNTIAALIAGRTPEEVRLPDDLKQLRVAPAQPSAGGTTCTVTNPDGTLTTISKLASEADCEESAKTANMENPSYKWDGTDKPTESLKDWKEHNKGWFEAAGKYGLTCNVDEDESKREETLSAFYSCVPTAYEAAAKKYSKEKEGEAGKKLAEQLSQPGFINDFLRKNLSANFANPANQYYCTNLDGTDKLDSNGKPMKLFTETGGYNPDCLHTRAPIQGGLYGTGDGEIKDTRRQLYDSSLSTALFDSSGTMADWANAGIMSAGAITRFANAALNLGMSPLMQTFGVDNLIAQVIETLRDSAFFPFLSTATLIGLILLAVRGMLFKKGGLKDFIKFLGAFLLIGIIGTATLLKPHETIRTIDRSVNFADAFIAKALVTDIIGDEICSSTGAKSSIKFSTTRSDADPATRALMCEVWRMNVLSPWSYAQWGTGYNNLYAVDAKRPVTANTLTNTNSAQVSRAPVQMGAGVTVNNWALYQLDLMTTGTTTENNPNRTAGVTSRDLYRIVDVQAGPNNGEGTDPRYLRAWAGREGSSRALVGTLSPIAALATGVTVGYYSVVKAVVKAVLLLMMVILPFVLLMALLGRPAKKGTKHYVGTVIGLYIQSAMLTFGLCLLSVVLINLTASVDSYIYIFLLQTIISILMLLWTRKLMKKVMRGSGALGSVNMTDTKNILSKSEMGKRAVRTLEMAPGRIKHAAVSGYTKNGIRGALQESAQAVELKKIFSKPGREGALRTITTARATGLAAARESVQDLDNYKNVSKIADNLAQITAAEQGVVSKGSSISELKSAGDIRRARKATEAYNKVQDAKRAEVEENLEKEYEAQRQQAELAGMDWARPSDKERKKSVDLILQEQERAEEAGRSVMHEHIQQQMSGKPVPKSERYDIQSDDRFTDAEKAIHKVLGNERELSNAVKSKVSQVKSNVTDAVSSSAAVQAVRKALTTPPDVVPEEVSEALEMSRLEVSQLPVERLRLLREWLEANQGTDYRNERAELLEYVLEAIRYKEDA